MPAYPVNVYMFQRYPEWTGRVGDSWAINADDEPGAWDQLRDEFGNDYRNFTLSMKRRVGVNEWTRVSVSPPARATRSEGI